MPADLPTLLRRFWHPVATVDELAAAGGPFAVRLLGENLVIADLGDGPVALRDRCLHRSTRLSGGWLSSAPDGGGALQCPYHGWQWDGAGRCVGIPSLPEARPGAGLPARRIAAFECEVRYGLIWVRLETGWETAIPRCPAFDDASMRAVAGEPYTWPTSLERRVENFTDLAHFAWVHDGSLGDRSVPEVPIPEIRRSAGALRFAYDPPALPPEVDEGALVGASAYVVSMPGTVDISFDVPGAGQRALWMTASPVDSGVCRTFWFASRSDDLEGSDVPYLEFQNLVLAEDEPVVFAQDPPEIPWDGDRELSVRTDAVSLAYRRFLLDLAATDTSSEMAAVLAGVSAEVRS
jgi:phenylpropionate dioxygenase-like ring-hydroxylating dioxygenase large terminal subunit